MISHFSTRYPHPNPLSFLNFFYVLASGLPSAKFPLAQISSYATDVNESPMNRTKFTSSMRASFVDLLQQSVS